MKHVLEKRGYTVLATGCGEDALALIAKHAGPIDLVISDVMLTRGEIYAEGSKSNEVVSGMAGAVWIRS